MEEWSVWVGIEGDFDEGNIDSFLSSLKEYSPSLSFQPQGLETHITVAAPSASAAIEEGVKIISQRIPGVVRRLEAQRQADVEADLERANFPDLVGVSEIASLLGVSRQRVDAIARTHDMFPKPAVQLAAGPIWQRAAIERFLEEWPRRGGRPSKADQQRRLASAPAAMLGVGEMMGAKSLGAANYRANLRQANLRAARIVAARAATRTRRKVRPARSRKVRS